MSERDTLALVRAVVERVTGHTVERDFTPETALAELGIDSITLAEIVVQLEDVLDIDVAFAQWLRVRTVQGVLDMIDQARGSALS